MKIRHGRWLAVMVIGVALLGPTGCRQSKEKEKAEARQEQDARHEESLRIQEMQANNREEYESAKALVKQGEYEEAWNRLQEVAERDDDLAFEFEVYKNESLPEELFRQADRLSTIQQERYEEAWRMLNFVYVNMEKKRGKAEKKMQYVRRCSEASRKYHRALELVHQYKQPEAIALLEQVRDHYTDTPYVDLSIQQLRRMSPPDPGPVD